jgi:hypothetical protein
MEAVRPLTTLPGNDCSLFPSRKRDSRFYLVNLLRELLVTLIATGLIPRSLLRRIHFLSEVRHSRMPLAGIQAKF